MFAVSSLRVFFPHLFDPGMTRRFTIIVLRPLVLVSILFSFPSACSSDFTGQFGRWLCGVLKAMEEVKEKL
jgi:hypothetical protein